MLLAVAEIMLAVGSGGDFFRFRHDFNLFSRTVCVTRSDQEQVAVILQN